MAALPNALQLIEIKYGAGSTAREQIQAAQQLEAAGRIADALELFLLAGDDEAAAKLQARAVAEGRPALLISIERRGRTVSDADWKAAGEGAMQAQRWREAYHCFLRAGDEDALARAQEKIPDYELYLPQGK